MGKFDFVFNTEDTTTLTLTPEEAVAAIATVTRMAISNNQLDIETAASILSAFTLFAENSKEYISARVESIANNAVKDGLGAVFNQACESLHPDNLADAYAASFMMFFLGGEGELSDEEIELICELQEALGLEDEEADEILDVVFAQLAGEGEEEKGEKGEEEERKSQTGQTDIDLAEIAE
jgi:hypothetical protein